MRAKRELPITIKKAIFSAVFCAFFIQISASMRQDEIGVELFAGYNFSALANMNKNLINVFNYGYIDGYASPVYGKEIQGMLQADLKVRYSFAQNVPVYIRAALNRLVDTQILHNTVTGTDIAESIASFNIFYAGAGAKYGFSLPGHLSFFICGDLGICVPFDSYWSVTGNPAESPPVISDLSDPDYNASQRAMFTDPYLGANIGAGIEWQLSRGLGVIIEGGYKMAKYTLNYAKEGIFKNTKFDLNELDFSGPYASGGLVLYFGGK